MERPRGDPYVSCIKIRGVPIIPPLMTEDIRMEMRYYKHLALAVEERLKNLERFAHSESDLQSEAVTQNNISTTDDSSNCEAENESLDKTFNTDTVVDVPAKEILVENNYPNEPLEHQKSANLHECLDLRKSLSDTEASHQDETLPVESASSVFVTTSTDINQYLNDSFKSDTIAPTLENSPETRKPEVPKTLDIVPITVDAIITNVTAAREVTGDFEENVGISLDDECPKSSTSPDSDESTPKLVRQGSYVLDSPSPMLLAHLREETTKVGDYVPSATSNCLIKRKEWNISQAKTDWHLQRKKEAFIVPVPSRLSPYKKARRNSDNETRAGRSSVQSRTGGKYFVGTRQVARSADCIQSMLHGENTLKHSKSSSVAKINGHGRDALRNNEMSNSKSSRSVSILSLANKLGGSLGSLSNGYGYSSTRGTSQKQNASSRMSRSFESETKMRCENLRGSTQKLLSAVTSEKLVHVFKEIQNTHERQMVDLIARQQREQLTMQKEFEKQQILLLAQIEHTFPGICLSRLAEKIATPLPSPMVVRDDSRTSRDKREKTVSMPEPMKINGAQSPVDAAISKCPLDDIYPYAELKNFPTCETRREEPTKKLVKEPTSPPIGLYSTSVLNGERRNHGVNRQLFPLESKTRHVPVMNNVTYDERHVKSATIITAYSRGYLVRRIMQTERVIALKTTYREALHCMLKLHVDAPLALPELNFHQRLQLQCDAASMNIVELFAQEASKRMEIIQQDRQIKRARQERPNSARSYYSFATQRTLARKRLKAMGDFQTPVGSRPITARTRCQTWTSNAREKRSPSLINQGIKRSTSAGAVRKPWR